MSELECCPGCQATLQGRAIGVEVQGVYDGVLYWACPDCGHAWPRWSDGRLGQLSREYAARHGASRRW